LSEPFIDLEAGLYFVSLEPEINTKVSDPIILTVEELQQIKDDIERNMNFSSYKENNEDNENNESEIMG
jgi:hypothetical protein